MPTGATEERLAREPRSRHMIVVMAGLPATGKSTIARGIAQVLSGIVLDKDAVRAALFPPSEIDYSVAQDDLCMDVLLQVAGYILQRDRSKSLLIDGRPFARQYQIERWRTAAAGLDVPLKVIECVCTDHTARKRLACAAARGDHPAANRDYEMYLALKRSFEPIAAPELVLDTEQSVAQCLQTALAYLAESR